MKSIEILERKLKRSNFSERRKILQGVYKQLVPSHKGNQSNGEYRRIAEEGDEDSKLFLDFIVSSFFNNGLTKHYDKIMDKYIRNVPFDSKNCDGYEGWLPIEDQYIDKY